MALRSHRRVGTAGSPGDLDLGPALRRLADPDACFDTPRHELAPDPDDATARQEMFVLDDATLALVRLAALIALGGSPASYRRTVEAATIAGARIEEVVATLMAVAPTIGLGRLVSAAPSVALALGYDIEAAFEGADDRRFGEPSHGGGPSTGIRSGGAG